MKVRPEAGVMAPSGLVAPPSRGIVRSIAVSARPKQWVKNLFVFVAPAFGGVTHPLLVGRVLLTFAAFCIAASSLYLINDVCDRQADLMHERKRLRPIASGQLGTRLATVVAAAGILLSLALSALAAAEAAALLAAYVLVTVAYSLRLKHVVILDVLLIAAGFVLRVAAGAYAGQVIPSEWLLLCTMFLALFLGFGKRHHELVLLRDDAEGHRRVLTEYSRDLLSQFLGATMLGTLFSYALYTLLSPVAKVHPGLLLTVPFATYGIFRYMLLVETRSEGGAPEELLLVDRPLQLAIGLWALVVVSVLYWHRVF